MFDPQAVNLLKQLPSIEGFDGDVARSRLTEAYLQFLRIRTLQNAPGLNIEHTVSQLRDMANGMELYCIIEYSREGHLLESGRSAAFIAAQSLELLGEIMSGEQKTNGVARHSLADEAVFSTIESGLLYQIAGYYSNAATITRRISRLDDTNSATPTSYVAIRQRTALNLLRLLIGLLDLRLGLRNEELLLWPTESENEFQHAPSDIAASIEARLLLTLSKAVKLFLGYLAGEPRADASRATELAIQVHRIVARTVGPDSLERSPAEALLPHHLAWLLEIVFGELQEFATVHLVKPPLDSDDGYKSAFGRWLRAKADRGYALLWHSTRAYLDAMNETPTHLVISMPTGSGKSFLGELALVERLHRGWGLYIAPMNALVRQIRNDLEDQLLELDVNVRRFLTDEHTTLASEILSSVETKEIVVMTPEKASLAIRLRPEVFEKCSVCIFDECHLISKRDRGPMSEEFLYRLMALSPDVHIVLMSAMIQTPEKLATWLQKATAKTSKPILLDWKPTRSLRTLAIVSSESLDITEWEDDVSNPAIGLIGQADIAWRSQEDEALVVYSNLPTRAAVRRITRDNNQYYEWKENANFIGREIALTFAQRHIPTILFLQSRATDVWTHASKSIVVGELQQNLETASRVKIDSWLHLASVELGNESPLRQFHSQGVTVHSGALIDEERAAAELAYRKGIAHLMIATGTLSQGLNLPAQVVVMAGVEGSPYVGERTTADILNAMGRSGRAKFSNAGLSILVPNKIVRSKNGVEIAEALPRYWEILRSNDACLEPESKLKAEVDRMIVASHNLENQPGIAPRDLEIATMIFEQDGSQPRRVAFASSLAAHVSDDPTTFVSYAINGATQLVGFYVSTNKCPDWLPELSQKAGLSIALLDQMRRAIEKDLPLDVFVKSGSSFLSSLKILQTVVQGIRPTSISNIDLDRPDRGGNIYSALPKRIGNRDFDWTAYDDPEKWALQWNTVFKLLEHWMTGKTYAHIGLDFLPGGHNDLSAGLFPTEDLPIQRLSRKANGPLHKAIKTVRDISYPLRHFAGGMVILVSKLLIDNSYIQQDTDLPLSFGMLSQALDWGVDRLDKAFWYYYLFPSRSLAHVLSDLVPIAYSDDEQMEGEIKTRAASIRKSKSIDVPIADAAHRGVIEAVLKLID